MYFMHSNHLGIQYTWYTVYSKKESLHTNSYLSISVFSKEEEKRMSGLALILTLVLKAEYNVLLALPALSCNIKIFAL